MNTFDRDTVEGQSHQISAGSIDFSFLGELPSDPKPFAAGRQIPWNDPDFSRRMLAIHLDESHDLASRRSEKRKQIIDGLVAATSLAPGDQILDLGCGPGLYCQEFARRGFEVEGWDYAPAAIEYAVRQAKAAGLNIRYRRDDYRNLDAVERFDVVTLIYGDFNVFGQTDATALLRRIHRALRPGGYFYTDVTTPTAHPAQEVRQHFGYQASGLWSDEPYLELYEAHPVDAEGLRWERYVIIEAPTGRARIYTTWSQEYVPATLAALLEKAGFLIHAIHDDPSESPLIDELGWFGMLALKP